ncbi:LamG-like jellyroll fold domain-containing protein [Gimesia panareensis]|uniref:LamG-like jellyroll fold domain-containing protein n=1 Tax=Gimesia panareensis TaxID=2527978 RepID=UPI00118B4274|nr:FecR domain-containing protein [Gimesia panareensis]QDU47898.1 FecR protein [Gimesia panareensis]
MDDTRQLMARFVENRDSLSDDELEQLVSELRAQPRLAADLKDHLSVDDMLAQTFDLTRWHFLPQVDQRLRDESHDFSGLMSISLDFDKETESSRRNVAKQKHEARNGNPVNRAAGNPARKRRLFWPLTAASLLLIAGVVLTLLVKQRHDDRIAHLEATTGQVRVISQQRAEEPAGTNKIRPGDRLETSAESTAAIRYPDGTTVLIQENSSIAFPPHELGRDQKQISLEHGRLAADVAPQPSGSPMLFTSPDAQAEVLGTKLTLAVQEYETLLNVTVGRVRLTRTTDQKSVVVATGEIGVAGPKTLLKAPESWPSNRRGLLFLFETNGRPNQVQSITSGMNRSYTVRPRGRAHLNHNGAMVLTGGAFLANDVDGEILEECRRTNQLSVEATIIPSSAKQRGPARIVTFSTDISQRDFTLGQQGDQLIVRIRTPQTGANGVGDTETGMPVATLTPGQVNHVIVSYKPGRLVCYLNGKQTFETDQIQGDFRDWSAQHLLFGDEYGGQRDWSGTLEGVAIYNRFIEPEEAAQNALQYDYQRQSRSKVPQLRVRARLIEKSAIPTLKSILPHRAALVIYKYHIEKVLSGQTETTEIYVARWAVLDGKQLPVVKQKPDTESELLLEPYSLNPQVHHYFCSDDFSALTKSADRSYLEIQP